MNGTDKRIAITGGAGGIARQCARRFLARGADLLLIDPNEEALREAERALAAGDRVAVRVSALESEAACTAALAATAWRYHALVHLAGIFASDPLEAGEEAIWEQAIESNLASAYRMAKAFHALRAADEGPNHAVFVGSLAFNRGAGDYLPYTAAKGGIVGLTRGLALGARRAGQRARARRHRDRHAAGDDRRAWRTAPRRHSARPLRSGRRGRRGDRVPVRPRRQLHHRPDHQRRWRRRDGVARVPLPHRVVTLARPGHPAAGDRAAGHPAGGDQAAALIPAPLTASST